MSKNNKMSSNLFTISGDVQNNMKTTYQRRTRCQQGNSQNTVSLSDHEFEPTHNEMFKRLNININSNQPWRAVRVLMMEAAPTFSKEPRV